MAASFDFKATGFIEAVMQMNFQISQDLLYLNIPSIFVFNFGRYKLPFYISTVLELRKYDFSFDNTIEVSRDFLGGAPSFWVSTLPSFGGHGPCKCGDINNVFDLSPNHVIDVSHDFVGGGSLVLSHELAKFRIHRPCESGDITFFICHVTTILKCHMTLWVGSSHLKSPTG